MRLQLTARLRMVAAVFLAWIGAARGQSRTDNAWAAPASPAAPPVASAHLSDIDVHAVTAYGSYADTDHVFVQTPSIAGTVSNPVAGWSIGGEYLVDVVSAASVDIVSTASRSWREVRQEGRLDASYKPGTFGVAATGAVSDEPDYLSWTVGGSVTRDFFQKNLTLLLGYFHTHDTAGRTGTPFSVFSETLNSEAWKGAATVIVDRATLASIVADVIVESGNQAKPYRYIPLFAPGTHVPLGASIDLVTRFRVAARPLEQLPLSRDRFALSAQLAHRYRWSTLRLEERLYMDSWALFGSTTDARYLFDLSRRVETGPHARLHAQTAVSFWQLAYRLEPGFSYPEYRTGDRELGPLVNVTGGWSLKVGIGPARDPKAWVLGLDANVTSTRYLDDLYITQRISSLFGVSLEANL
jgi:hypothetical protein